MRPTCREALFPSNASPITEQVELDQPWRSQEIAGVVTSCGVGNTGGKKNESESIDITAPIFSGEKQIGN